MVRRSSLRKRDILIELLFCQCTTNFHFNAKITQKLKTEVFLAGGGGGDPE